MVFQLLKVIILVAARNFPYLNAFLFLMDSIVRKINRSGVSDSDDSFAFLDGAMQNLPDGERDRYTNLYAVLYHGLRSVNFLRDRMNADEPQWHGILVNVLIDAVRHQLVDLYDSDNDEILAQRKRYIELLATLYLYRDRQKIIEQAYKQEILASLIGISHLVDDFDSGYSRGLGDILVSLLKSTVNSSATPEADLLVDDPLCMLRTLHGDLMQRNYKPQAEACSLNAILNFNPEPARSTEIHLDVQQKLADDRFQMHGNSVLQRV